MIRFLKGSRTLYDERNIPISYSRPSRKLTYPSLGQRQGKSSSKVFFEKDILVKGGYSRMVRKSAHKRWGQSVNQRRFIIKFVKTSNSCFVTSTEFDPLTMCTLNHAMIWWMAALISTSSLITDPASVPAWIVTEQIGQEFLHCLGYARHILCQFIRPTECCIVNSTGKCQVSQATGREPLLDTRDVEPQWI